MAYLLFPGRHILNTSFQEKYLWEILRLPIKKLEIVGNSKLSPDEQITAVIFAVTSANQSHSRYNPVPFVTRAIGIDRFARPYKETLGISYSIVGIPHFDPSNSFASHLLKEVHESEGLLLNPENTIVLSSTPAVIKMFQDLGYGILTAEYDLVPEQYKAETPAEVLKLVVAAGETWQNDQALLSKLAKSTISLWHDFPLALKTIFRIWADPLLTDSGSLTKERNYSTYASGMNHGALMDVKYNDIKSAVLSGKVVDEGCADGALVVRLAADFPDSDIIGIEITSEFLARCEERLRAGEFGGTYVHFHQRNLINPIFEDNSIDSTICNSTTHEIWSYGNREESLKGYIEKKYKQTRNGGRLIIRDVVGPEDKDQEVYLALNDTDGSNDDIFAEFQITSELAKHLAKLSTHARFLRFAEDYLKDMRALGKRGEETKIKFREEIIDSKKFVVLRLKDAIEFMTKKDYADNWRSELNEEFAFYSFSDWKRLLVSYGFSIVENPNNPQISSRVYANAWIVDNRFRGKADLFRQRADGSLEPLEYPVTNMVLIGEKRG